MMQTSTCKKPGISVIRSASMNENGAVLVIALMFVALLTLLGSTAVVLTTTDMKIGANYKDSELAFNNAQAGVQYAIGKMEEGLKAWPRTFTLPVSTTTPVSLSTFDASNDTLISSDFGFTLSDITRVSPDPPPDGDDIYEFANNGIGAQGSTASITVRIKRLPVFDFAVFGDELLDLGAFAAVCSYSFTANPVPTALTCEDEADIGSNKSVILRNNAVVQGDVVVGEDTAGTDGTVTNQGGVVSGEIGADIPRVDPDPWGILNGALADDFSTYSGANDNSDTTLVFDPDGSIIAGPEIYVKSSGDTLTLKGKLGGANYYFVQIRVRSDAVLYIDTTNGPVNIYLTGPLTAGNGAEIVNTVHSSCSTGSCSCCIPPAPPNPLDCVTSCNNPLTNIGAPGDFMLFVNSTNDPSEKITLGNSSVFSGVIYAPYIEVVLNNSADVYGSIIAKRVDIVNDVRVFYDTDLQDGKKSNDLKIISWRDNRM